MHSLHLLGPPELRHAGRPIALTVKKTWAVVLALACGGRTLRPRLAAQLWPALDETTARRNLRRELARLREAAAQGLVQAEGDWLALHADVDTDLVHFESAVRAGDSERALALWRGPLADGLWLGDDAPEFDRWLVQQRERVRGLWRRAMLARAQQVPPDRALEHWQALLADDPLQEDGHRAVMRLYAAAGRREAALAQYTQLQALLRDELGLAPAAETEALAATLRSGGETASPAPAATSGSTAHAQHTSLLRLHDELPFVGRAAEVAAMEAAWRSGRMIVIEGVGGVGKTRLALDFAAAHGPYALARCRSGDRDVPYAAWTRTLRALAGPEPTRASLGALPAWACDELARLMPEFALAGPGPQPIRSDDERSRFFEANALGWQALTAESFDAVVLDDWHHADAASRAMLAFVVQRRLDNPAVPGAREIVLLRPELDDEAATAWRALREGAHALHLPLPALSPAVVLDLLRLLSGASDPARFAARLQSATAGNPFFLHETLRHLAETGLLDVDAEGVWRTPFDDATQDYRELPVPASVREAVLARVQHLGDACHRVLEAAALAAEPFTPALLAPACALSELDAVHAIEHAVQAQLLREHEAGGFAFAHDLVQQALDSALAPERRRLVHRRLALGAEAAGAPAAVVAAHHEASGDRRRAVAHRLAAGEQAQRLHALPEAMAHWRAALADGAAPAQALRAHQGLMLAARLRCEFDAMLVHGEALQGLATEDLASDERAGALVSVADNLVFGNRAALALEILERLPPELPEPLLAQALIVRARALHGLGRIDETRAAVGTALGLAALQASARGNLLDLLILAEIGAGDMVAARLHADAVLALGRSAGDEEIVALALFRRGLTWLIDGDLARAEAELQQAADSFASRGSVYRQRSVLYNLCVLHEAQNHHAQALAAAQRGWDLLPPLPPGELCTMYRLAFVDAHAALGDLGAAWGHAQAAIAAVLAQVEPQPLLAATQCTLELLGLLGETALARQLLAAAQGLSVDELQYAASEYWVAVAQFELAQGDAAAARRALAAAPAVAEMANARVRARHALALAELHWAQGDAAGALARLPGDADEGMNDEMRTRALALAVRVQSCGGALTEATRQAARAALERPSPYVPATLQLHRALAQAARAGVAGADASAPQAHADFVAGLARSLDRHAPQQAAFVQRSRRS